MNALVKKWFTAYCEANDVSEEEVIEKFMECMADHAGKRPVSWEAEVGSKFATYCGWTKFPRPVSEVVESELDDDVDELEGDDLCDD